MEPTESTAPHPASHGQGYETRDANPRALMIFGAVLVVSLVVVQLGLLGVYRVFEHERKPEPETNAPVNLYQQLQTLRQNEDDTLTSYDWIDRKAGIIRIPIDRAMDLVAERGVPKGKGPQTDVEINSHHGTPVTVEAKDPKK